MRHRWWGRCVVGVILIGSGMQSAEAVILINEVLADPPSLLGDANRDGVVSSPQDEFIELVNTEDALMSLAGWSLSDSVKVRHIFSPDAAIPPQGFFVVFGGGSPQGFAHAAVASKGSLGLNNEGDTVTLRNDQGLPIDAMSYGPEGGMDMSLTRSPDGAGAFMKHHLVSAALFSPGTTTDGDRTLPQPQRRDPSAPEPASFLLLGSGLSVLLRRRKK